MTTTQTAPTTDTLAVTPRSTPDRTSKNAPKGRHTKALVAGGILAALVVAGATAGFFALARDDAPSSATSPAVVGTIEDDSAVVHGGAGQLATVGGLPLQAVGSGTASDPMGATDLSVAHGAGDDVVSSAGLVHG